MKTLSDYRINERNELFIVEVKKVITTKRFLRKDRVSFVWDYCCVCDTLEKAKEQIIKLCKEPKYHYVILVSDIVPAPNFPNDCLDYCLMEYMDKKQKELEARLRQERIAKTDRLFINEAIKINPLFYKLIEKYEEKVKTGWNPKTIEKSYADLVLENFELTVKNKELEIQLHELKKEQTKK